MGSVSLDKKVLGLPARRRASLAARLLASLDEKETTPHAKEWSEELEARITAHDEGGISAVPAARVLAYRGKSRR